MPGLFPASKAGLRCDAEGVRRRLPVDVLILLVRDGRILLTERAGDIYPAGHWAIPGDKADGETVTRTAAREVAEEVGLTVGPGRLRFVGVIRHRPPHGDSRVGFGFLAETDADTEPANLEPEKRSRLTWHGPSRLPEAELG